MDWVRPLDEIEAEFRRHGSFLLVDTDGQLRYYGLSKCTPAQQKLLDSMKGRTSEMAKYLTARARAKGEIT